MFTPLAFVVVTALAFVVGAVPPPTQCHTISLIPFSTEEPVCGWKTLQVSNPVMSQDDIASHVGVDWQTVEFDDSNFICSCMPMGESVSCPQLPTFLLNPWSPASNLFIRRVFELDQATYDKLSLLEVAVMLDKDLLSCSVNNMNLAPQPSLPRDTCDEIARVDRIVIPKSKLVVGPNVLSVHVRSDAQQAFVNIALDAVLCAVDLHLCHVPEICEKRCPERDMCIWTNDCSLHFEYNAEGPCVCEMQDAELCSIGAPEDPHGHQSGACYPNVWVPGAESVRVACPLEQSPCN